MDTRELVNALVNEQSLALRKAKAELIAAEGYGSDLPASVAAYDGDGRLLRGYLATIEYTSRQIDDAMIAACALSPAVVVVSVEGYARNVERDYDHDHHRRDLAARFAAGDPSVSEAITVLGMGIGAACSAVTRYRYEPGRAVRFDPTTCTEDDEVGGRIADQLNVLLLHPPTLHEATMALLTLVVGSWTETIDHG